MDFDKLIKKRRKRESTQELGEGFFEELELDLESDFPVKEKHANPRKIRKVKK